MPELTLYRPSVQEQNKMWTDNHHKSVGNHYLIIIYYYDYGARDTSALHSNIIFIFLITFATVPISDSDIIIKLFIRTKICPTNPLIYIFLACARDFLPEANINPV